MNPIFITGDYGTDPSHGDNLNKAIHEHWKSHFGIDMTMSVYDRDVLALVPTTGPVPPLIGFSFGFAKVVQLCHALQDRGQTVPRVINIDGVPNNKLSWPGWPLPDPKPLYPGFDLPPSVNSAYSIWRGYDNQHFLYSGPIRSAKCQFLNQKYNPKPGEEAVQHGQYCWDPYAKLVVDWLRAA